MSGVSSNLLHSAILHAVHHHVLSMSGLQKRAFLG